MHFTDISLHSQYDFVELRVNIARPTNIKGFRSALAAAIPAHCQNIEADERLDAQADDLDLTDAPPKKPAGYPARDQDPNSCTIWTFRVYDPEHRDDLDQTVASLDSRFGVVGAPEITAIELAVDARNRGDYDPEALSAYLAHVTTGHNHFGPEHDRMMYFRARRRFDVPTRQTSLARMFLAGYNCGIGNVNPKHGAIAPVRAHSYFKVWDRGAELPEKRHRARFEIRLQESELRARGITTLDDLAAIDARSAFGDYFQFRRLRDDLSAYSRALAGTTFPVHSRAPRGPAKNGRQFHRCSVADVALNKKMGIALDKLTQRWNRPSPEPARTPAATATTPAATPARPEPSEPATAPLHKPISGLDALFDDVAAEIRAPRDTSDALTWLVEFEHQIYAEHRAAEIAVAEHIAQVAKVSGGDLASGETIPASGYNRAFQLNGGTHDRERTEATIHDRRRGEDAAAPAGVESVDVLDTLRRHAVGRQPLRERPEHPRAGSDPPDHRPRHRQAVGGCSVLAAA
ncbi:MAG: hypothetical protein KDH17_09700 [Rhodocyclaceae bacterium]|nr:hypothetical protein [Rhodocyclaceae bacterium]MCP5234806.1 hypothetical protein [Zoogloeaceae bacterium]